MFSCLFLTKWLLRSGFGCLATALNNSFSHSRFIPFISRDGQYFHTKKPASAWKTGLNFRDSFGLLPIMIQQLVRVAKRFVQLRLQQTDSFLQTGNFGLQTLQIRVPSFYIDPFLNAARCLRLSDDTCIQIRPVRFDVIANLVVDAGKWPY